MKKTIFIISIIFIFTQNHAEASVEKRYLWWKLRLEKIENAVIDLQKDKLIDNSVISLMKREIVRGKTMMEIIQNKMGNSEPGGESVKTISKEDIKFKLERLFLPFFSLYYLNHTMKNIGDREVMTHTRNLISEKIKKIGSGSSADKIAAQVLENDINKNDWKNLSLEMFIGGMMRNRNAASEDINRQVYEEVSKKAESNNFLLSNNELNNLIVDALTDKLEKYNFSKADIFSDEVIKSAWNWKYIENRAIRNKFKFEKSKDESGNTDKITAGLYEYRIKRNREYLEFIKDLYKNASEIFYTEKNSIKEMFADMSAGSGRMIRFFHNTLSIERNEQSLLGKDNLTKIVKMKSDFEKELKGCQSEINVYCKKYFAERSRMSKNINTAVNGSKDLIARKEIDIFTEGIKDYINILSSYKYAEALFFEYRIIYDRYYNEVKSGNISENVRESLSAGSLFMVLPGFNREKLDREYRSRRFLKKECLTAISLFSSVLQYYKKMNLDIKDVSIIKDLEEMKVSLNAKHEQKIGSWVINDNNYNNIDRNLVKELYSMMKKSVWSVSDAGSGEAGGGNKFSIKTERFNITIDIPRGWNEKKVSGDGGIRESIKIFESMDHSSTIEMAKMPLKDGTLKDISEEWLRKPGIILVKKEWGKNESGEFYWVLSREGNNTIAETYTVANNGYIFFFTGRVLKEKYQFFKGKFDGAFNSMNIQFTSQSMN